MPTATLQPPYQCYAPAFTQPCRGCFALINLPSAHLSAAEGKSSLPAREIGRPYTGLTHHNCQYYPYLPRAARW